MDHSLYAHSPDTLRASHRTALIDVCDLCVDYEMTTKCAVQITYVHGVCVFDVF